MTAKEYLNQAYRVERMVGVKLEQLQAYKTLSTKAASTLSLSPNTGTPNIHRMEDIIIKIMDLENEIIADMHKLLDMRLEISQSIKNVGNTDYRMLLELRYLCYMPWEEIAVEMRYSTQRVFQLHSAALEEIRIPIQD
jgi:DNA-directed RNA polymerase specialized sigma subunit